MTEDDQPTIDDANAWLSDETPVEEIEDVISWLTDRYAAGEDTGQRFYINLVVDLLYRLGGLHPALDSAAQRSMNFHTEDEYTVMFRWNRSDAVYQIEGLVIQRNDGNPFLVSDLRKLRWRDLIDEDAQKRLTLAKLLNAMNSFILDSRSIVRKDEWEAQGYGAAFADHLDALTAPKSKRYNRDHYVEVARLYDEALKFGLRTPNRYIAEHLSGDTPTSTVKNWVVECRRLGLLPPTTERRAKGNPL